MATRNRPGLQHHLFALVPALVIVGLLPTPARAQGAAPPGWRWGTDHPARAGREWNRHDSTWQFVQMAPGWHITTRPGAMMYDPSLPAAGHYVLESVQILFPGSTQSGYGLFFGAGELDGPEARYLTFLLRRDGHLAVEMHRNAATTSLVPWTPSSAIQRVTGDSTARNVLRVAVRPDSVTFEVNAARVAALPRGQLELNGFFGFRTGPDLNLHVTSLDYTRRLAPFPRR